MKIFIAALIFSTGITAALADDASNMRLAFNELGEESRKDLQKVLQSSGYYNSSIDGRFGQKTAEALARFVDDYGISMNTINKTLQDLVSFVPASDLKLIGTWQCGDSGGHPYIWGRGGLQIGNDLQRYRSIDIFDDAFGIEYVDGYRTYISDFKGNTLTWNSPFTGDHFDCKRISDAADVNMPVMLTNKKAAVVEAGQAGDVSIAKQEAQVSPVADHTLEAQSESEVSALADDNKVAQNYERLDAQDPIIGNWKCKMDVPDSFHEAYGLDPNDISEINIATSEISIQDSGASSKYRYNKVKKRGSSSYLLEVNKDTFFSVINTLEGLFFYDGGIIFMCQK